MIACILCDRMQTHRVCSECFNKEEPQWERCDVCDHAYRPGQPCEGTPVGCTACCTNADSQMVYVPQYVIPELVL